MFFSFVEGLVMLGGNIKKHGPFAEGAWEIAKALLRLKNAAPLRGHGSIKEKAEFLPAAGVAQTDESLFLNLADALAGHVEALANFLQGVLC